ncbi:tyrosine-type recombinase/integrase [Arthrobacter rhombi]|uniref:tyrosine-type recombinase/integrase n=1 Tax=Arthrobacter rhombi TaxID=71253 RepID=UPI003FCEEBC4
MSTELATLDTPANGERCAALVAAWLLSLTSENTRRAYRRDLDQYMSWMDDAGADALTVRRPMVDAYRLSLTGSPSTVARKLAAVSSFYGYALDAGTVETNPVARVKRPQVDADASTTQGLTIEQARAVLAVSAADGLRSHALAALLLTSGVRIGEVLGATTADYGHDAGHRVLTVTRKGGKRAKVALAAPAVSALDAYLGTTGSDVATSTVEATPLFTTATGKRWAASEAFRTVQRLAAAAGIPGRISPHSFRHTFATIHLDAGGSLRDLQDSMGHADPRTTRRYDRARGNLQHSASYTVATALAV